MNQRTMSNMWMPMSPMVPLPYSMNARQLRWISGLYGHHGSGPHPEVPVERLGHGGGLRRGGPPAAVGVDLHVADGAELALPSRGRAPR